MPVERIGPRFARHRSARIALLCLCLAVVASLALALTYYASKEIVVADIEATIRAWGAWGVLAAIGLMVLHSFVPFPAEIVAFANGMVYGPLWGTVITWTGAMLGALVAFGLARRLGRPFVERMVARNHWHVVDNWVASEGWQVALVSRFIPVIAFNLINYAAGLSRLTWWQFFWTTGVGILPLTFLMVVMGDNVETLGWQSWLILLAAGVVLWFLLRRKLGLRRGHGAEASSEGEPGPLSVSAQTTRIDEGSKSGSG
jgi:uncharacterized membrane protein YdjX (TVP38/TMEM64 family)